MTKAVSILISVMIASSISVAAQADIYRCTVNGSVQYTDRPCADGERVIQSNTSNSTQKVDARLADDSTAVVRLNELEDRRAEVEARKREVESMVAKREADDLWKRRNMSVSCFTQKYNVWVAGRSPRPTTDEIDQKIGELLRECRDIYRIPQDIPPMGTGNAQR